MSVEQKMTYDALDKTRTTLVTIKTYLFQKRVAVTRIIN